MSDVYARPLTLAERLVLAVSARELLMAAAGALTASGVVPMPLKGVLLQATVYADPADRPVSDVDLLAPPGAFHRAAELLVAAGAQELSRGKGDATRTFRLPGHPLPLDLHDHPLRPGMFHLRALDMFARGHLDEALFGVPLVLPDPLDLYAHLVGHFAKGRLGEAHRHHVGDLARVAEHHRLLPADVAARLEDVGLARAARYVLGVAVAAGDAFARDVLAELRPDPVGQACAAAAARALRRGPQARLTAVGSHLLNTSLPRGAASLASHAVGTLLVHARRRAR